MNTHARDSRRALAAAAAALALLAALVDRRGAAAPAVGVAATEPSHRAESPRTVDAVQLAAWIRDGARDLRVLDLRGDSAYERRHVPSAERADFARLDSLASASGTTIVVYSDDDVRDAQAWAALDARGQKDAFVLNGGMSAWMEEVMSPVLHGDSADHLAALSRYFGGSPRSAAAVPSSALPPRAGVPASPPPATENDDGSIGRRGC